MPSSKSPSARSSIRLKITRWYFRSKARSLSVWKRKSSMLTRTPFTTDSSKWARSYSAGFPLPPAAAAAAAVVVAAAAAVLAPGKAGQQIRKEMLRDKERWGRAGRARADAGREEG